MVCIICYESIFKAPASNSVSARGANNPPAALGCGHTFHKQCIQEWFGTSERSACPTCHKLHNGPVLKLFIDIDENDITAEPARSQTAASSNCGGRKKQTARRGGGQSSRGRGGSSRGRDGDNVIDDLYAHLGDLSISQGPEIAFMSAYGYSTYLQDELDNANECIEGLSDTIKDLKNELQTQKDSHREELAQKDSRYTEEIVRMRRLSVAHRTHIASLQRALEARKQYIETMKQSLYGNFIA
ncbi:hypothetical protein H4R24_004440 [Coemansia sp. RSA 988]|nr:hypothetical protein H4R24_004440 [Coemansia sp. RSA 988]